MTTLRTLLARSAGSFLLRALTLLLLIGTLAVAADDVLSTYKKRYQKEGFLSDREAVIQELSATGDRAALAALRWCVSVSEELIEDHRKDSEKNYKKLQPIAEKLHERVMKWVTDLEERGKPIPEMRPKFPEDDKRLEFEAAIRRAEKAVVNERKLLASIRGAHGKLVAALPEKDQEKLTADWKKLLEREKDWGVRAQEYRFLGSVPTEWALHMVQDAAVNEADPRALAAALEALGGKEPAKVNPILLERLKDTRWLVRVAVIEALERTPSKEGIDAIVALMQGEDGRLLDDCTRVLRTLTGADIRAEGDLWRRYWEANREAWNGPPPPPKEPDPLDPMSGLDQPKSDEEEAAAKGAASVTGFFGLEVKSRRIVYVIDVSGSMNEVIKETPKPKPKAKPKDPNDPADPQDPGEAEEPKPADKLGGAPEQKPKTRADLAKAELRQAVLALEDGALFNIVFYSNTVRLWQREMTLASSETRRSAVEFVDGMEVIGGTATHDALEAAFTLGDVGSGKKQEADPTGDAKVDTVILLSDGIPTVGKVTDPDGILAVVRQWNETRRIAVHTVSFGDADAKGFMAKLAEQNGGQSVEK